MSFTNWIKKLDNHSQEELRQDLLPLLTNDDLMDYLDDIVDEIHNRGIDLEKEYSGYERQHSRSHTSRSNPRHKRLWK